MRWNRQEYLDHMTFKDSPRPMLSELFGPLVGLPEEWTAQGATPEELNLTAFGLDWVETVSCGASTGAFGLPDPCVLEEDERVLITRDGLGRTMKLVKRSATIPLPMSHPVACASDWERLRPHFTFRPERISEEQLRTAVERQRAGALVLCDLPGGFDFPRQLMGEEALCFACVDEPELLDDMLQVCADTTLRCLERVMEHVRIDVLHVHEDMAGKSGPLLGPAQVGRFIAPYYRRVWSEASRQGVRLFSQDSDGFMEPVMSVFAEAGINASYPCEPAAGMDIVSIRERFGKAFALKGGIDKHVLREDKAAIRRELEYKLQPKMWAGTVFGLDHRIPNGTSLENYRYYVKTAKEMLGLPDEGQRGGWRRMAF